MSHRICLLACSLALCSLLLSTLAQGREVATIELVDQNGEAFQLASLRGSVVLLVFGFTHCPYICPVELARASAALRDLSEHGDKVRAVFVTVDPQRDTPQVIRRYLSGFHPSLIGLTGSAEDLAAVADHYRVKQQRQDSANGDYLVDHGNSLYILNQRGDAEMLILPGLPPEHIVEVVVQLLDNPDS